MYLISFVHPFIHPNSIHRVIPASLAFLGLCETKYGPAFRMLTGLWGRKHMAMDGFGTVDKGRGCGSPGPRLRRTLWERAWLGEARSLEGEWNGLAWQGHRRVCFPEDHFGSRDNWFRGTGRKGDQIYLMGWKMQGWTVCLPRFGTRLDVFIFDFMYRDLKLNNKMPFPAEGLWGCVVFSKGFNSYHSYIKVSYTPVFAHVIMISSIPTSSVDHPEFFYFFLSLFMWCLNFFFFIQPEFLSEHLTSVSDWEVLWSHFSLREGGCEALGYRVS